MDKMQAIDSLSLSRPQRVTQMRFNFRRWVVYTNITSCVINNGWLSSAFSLEQWVSLRAGSLVWGFARVSWRRSRQGEPAKPARRMGRGKVSLHAGYWFFNSPRSPTNAAIWLVKIMTGAIAFKRKQKKRCDHSQVNGLSSENQAVSTFIQMCIAFCSGRWFFYYF